MTTYQAVLSDASQLSLSERIQLIEALWDTVPEDKLPGLSDAWMAEIDRRCAEFDAGGSPGIPWSEVQANAIRRLESK